MNKTLLALSLLLASCGGQRLSAATYDGVWPLAPESGHLVCRTNVDTGDRMVTFRDTEGTEYALNGGADNAAARFGFVPIEESYRTDASGARMDGSALIEQGLELCP